MNVLLRRLRPQRMVQVAQALEDPRFAPAVRHVSQRGEPRVALGGVGRQRLTHECELRLAIRILHAVELLIQDRASIRDVADGELLSEPDVVGLRESQSRHHRFLLPHVCQPRERRRRLRRVAQRGEPRRLEAL